MKQIIISLLVFILIVSSVIAQDYTPPPLSEVEWSLDVNEEEFDEVSEELWKMEDFIHGRNLQLVDFVDDSTFRIIDTLLYEEQLKSNHNKFKGSYYYEKHDWWEDDVSSIDNFFFSGVTKFDDKSILKYELTEPELIYEFEVNEWLTKGVWDAYLEYEIQLTLTRRIPVSVYTEFYDDGEYWENIIDIVGDDVSVIFQNDIDYGRGSFKHKRKCSGECY